jgi:hypothetical protein
VIEQHQVGAHLRDQGANLVRFPAADEQARIRRAARAGDYAQNVRARRARKRLELAQLLRCGRTSESDAYQERTFATSWTFKQR